MVVAVPTMGKLPATPLTVKVPLQVTVTLGATVPVDRYVCSIGLVDPGPTLGLVVPSPMDQS